MSRAASGTRVSVIAWRILESWKTVLVSAACERSRLGVAPAGTALAPGKKQPETSRRCRPWAALPVLQGLGLETSGFGVEDAHAKKKKSIHILRTKYF